jgi:hypothetical protein
MSLSQKSFLASGTALAMAPVRLFSKDSLSGLEIGVTDWNLKQTGKLDGSVAKFAAFDW